MPNEYTEISRAEFESILSKSFKPVQLPKTQEIVYQRLSTLKPGIALRIYSSIDPVTNKTRPYGSDAIRTVLVHVDTNLPVSSQTSTYRIETWKNNLNKKIETCYKEMDTLKTCPKCKGYMTIRKSKKDNKEFLGCVHYPNCTGTLSL